MSAYEFVMDYVVEPASTAFTATGEFLNENEWAADALTGAAVGAGNYLVQKDKQEARRKEATTKFDRKTSLAQAPDINMQGYGLTKGKLTNGLLTGGMNQ